MTFSNLLIHILYRQIPYSSQNEFGEWTTTYSSQTNRPIHCRVSTWTIPEMMRLDRGAEMMNFGEHFDVRYKCFISGTLPTSSLRSYDRIQLSGNRYGFENHIFKVKDVVTDSSGFEKSALLAEL